MFAGKIDRPGKTFAEGKRSSPEILLLVAFLAGLPR